MILIFDDAKTLGVVLPCHAASVLSMIRVQRDDQSKRHCLETVGRELGKLLQRPWPLMPVNES